MGITNEEINKLIGVKFTRDMPDILFSLLMDENKKIQLFDKIINIDSDLSRDLFTDYFQTEHSQRDNLKQDFTPDCVGELLAQLAGKADSFADICAGCGGLTVKAWNYNPQAFFYCEELDSKVIPLLLFNLSIRNMQALVVHGNTITGERGHVYRLTPTDKYSHIEEITGQPLEDIKVDCVISNPPYSLPWTPREDSRLQGYGIPPASKADFVFLLHGLHLLNESGRAFYILPPGDLFRGGAEGDIRKQLIERGHLSALIGLSAKLFLNTDIPVCIWGLTKKPQYKPLLFIDSSGEFTKGRRQNSLSAEQITKIINIYKRRIKEYRFSNTASISEIQANGYDLNLHRYVSIHGPCEYETYNLLFEIDKGMRAKEEAAIVARRLIEKTKKLAAETENARLGLDRVLMLLEDYI